MKTAPGAGPQGAFLPPGNRREQRNDIPVVERGIEPGQEMYVPPVFQDVDQVTEGIRSGKQQPGQALVPPGQLIEPVGIAVNQHNEVVVCDTGNRRIQVFQSDGVFVREYPVFGWDEFYSEPYIALDGDSAYVTDSYVHRFARYTDGKLTGVWGKTGNGNGEFNRPMGFTIKNVDLYFKYAD